jgi:hypothetical protein
LGICTSSLQRTDNVTAILDILETGTEPELLAFLSTNPPGEILPRLAEDDFHFLGHVLCDFVCAEDLSEANAKVVLIWLEWYEPLGSSTVLDVLTRLTNGPLGPYALAVLNKLRNQ